MAALGFEPTADSADDGAAVLVEDGTGDTLDWSNSETDPVVDPPDIDLNTAPDLADGFEAAPPTTAEADDAMTPPKGKGKGPQTYRRSSRARPTPKPSVPPMPDPSTALDTDRPADTSPHAAIGGNGVDPSGFDDPDRLDGAAAVAADELDEFALDGSSSGMLGSDATAPIPAGRFYESSSVQGAHSPDPPPPTLDEPTFADSDRTHEALVVDGLSLDVGPPPHDEPSRGRDADLEQVAADLADGQYAGEPADEYAPDEAPGLFDAPPVPAADAVLTDSPTMAAETILPDPPPPVPSETIISEPPPPAPPETILAEAPPTSPPMVPSADVSPGYGREEEVLPGNPPPPIVIDPTAETNLNPNGAVAAPAGAGATIAARSGAARVRGSELAARMPQLLDQGILKRTRRVRARKVRRVVRHIDPWSVLTFSVLFFLCLFAALLLASVLVWNAAVAAGTIENIESFITEIGDYQTYEINGDVVFRAAMVIAGILTLAASVMLVLLVVVFNLISDLVGGIRVTVVEEETIRVHRLNQ